VKALALLGRVIELDRKVEIPSDPAMLRGKLSGIQNNVQIDVVYEDRPGSREPVIEEVKAAEGEAVRGTGKTIVLEGKDCSVEWWMRSKLTSPTRGAV